MLWRMAPKHLNIRTLERRTFRLSLHTRWTYARCTIPAAEAGSHATLDQKKIVNRSLFGMGDPRITVSFFYTLQIACSLRDFTPRLHVQLFTPYYINLWLAVDRDSGRIVPPLRPVTVIPDRFLLTPDQYLCCALDHRSASHAALLLNTANRSQKQSYVLSHHNRFQPREPSWSCIIVVYSTPSTRDARE